MMNFRKAQENDLKTLAAFIETHNTHSDAHIGYCGSNQDEIENALLEDIDDIPFTESFILGYDEETLIAVLGFDYDDERATAEIWGPFMERPYWAHVDAAWGKLQELFPKSLEHVHCFPNKNNTQCIEWIQGSNFTLNSEELTFKIDADAVSKLPMSDVQELTAPYWDALCALHDKTFPGTYYSGHEMLQRQDPHQKIFIHTIDESLSGYIYVEADPEFNEGSIEFFGVDPLFRGQGIGLKLITHALKFIFSFEGTQSVQLCVSASTPSAIHLYEKVGFKKQHTLSFYSKSLNI